MQVARKMAANIYQAPALTFELVARCSVSHNLDATGLPTTSGAIQETDSNMANRRPLEREPRT